MKSISILKVNENSQAFNYTKQNIVKGDEIIKIAGIPVEKFVSFFVLLIIIIHSFTFIK